jgi:hypothetical protein
VLDLSGEWRKSRYSGINGCVEVAFFADFVQVRDSKDRTGPALTFTVAEWQAFVAAVHDGEFGAPAVDGELASGLTDTVGEQLSQSHPAGVRCPSDVSRPETGLAYSHPQPSEQPNLDHAARQPDTHGPLL